MVDQLNVQCNIQGTQQLKRGIIEQLQAFFHANNAVVNMFKTALERMPSDTHKFVIRADCTPTGEHLRKFNAPTVNDVAAIIVGDPTKSRDIVVQRRSNIMHRVNETHRLYDTLQYPIIYWQGQDGYDITLKMVDPITDGFLSFRSSFPEWCDSCSELLDSTGGALTAPTGQDPLPLMGLRSLRISAPPLHRPHRTSLSSTANSSTESSDTDDRCDSSLGLEDDRGEFPVEILPCLFLGNGASSEDSQALARHNIQYVLNVTKDLPNVFEKQGNMKYLQIHINDHWSQNLASHFPSAIAFIDEARNLQKGVLVHCLAGVSRSVTVTVAYLMSKYSLNLNDAFNVVRSRKSNIAPNFHFLQQLYNFERELKLDVSSQSPLPLMEQLKQDQKDRGNKSEQKKDKGPCQNCGLKENCKCKQHSDFLSPLAQIGVSPDSGIEFDRWATGTPGE
ncbi:mitogen-activated protein kinase phosphatase 3 isoform X1 [Leptinotarsa decemlineata]|uniref:mitogen-activated protein kinase phosphatase 3 isoform X1 n=1 Tax=Leptinotarsa decemlineata TaxID=7539 RepID=UPI003D30410F